MKNRLSLLGITVVILIAISIQFQSCGKAEFSEARSGSATITKHEVGNGDFYAGKPQSFNYFDPRQPCLESSIATNVLPNRQIQIKEEGPIFLVRDACRDIDPAPISRDVIAFGQDLTNFTFEGQAFVAQADPLAFDILPTQCPTGLTATGSKPANLFVNPLSLDALEWTRPGLLAELFGSVLAMPRYRVARSDASNLEFYRRISQKFSLDPGTRYAVNFVIAQGNTNSASIIHWDTGLNAFDVRLDFASGTLSQESMSGFTDGGATTRVSRLGSAYLSSVFFTAPPNVGAIEIGVTPTNYVAGSPQNGQVGDHIFVSGASMYRVADYCR